ncbi:pyridine nucleotide-disulfide oxidoreductase domain-containing protein, partial [Euroglyphus maynei]
DHGSKKTTGKPIKRARYGQIKNVNNSSVKNEFGVALGPDWSRELNLKGVKSRKKVMIETKVEIVNVYHSIDSIPDNISKKIDKNESWNIYVELTNGKIIGCDMIIVAIGVIPNSDVFVGDNNYMGLQLAADKGIMVDREMRTNLNDIYAAGDVCTVNWPQSPHWFQMRLWTQARQMGFYAAKCIQWHMNLANSDDPNLYFNFEVFTHVTQFFGFRVILLGLYDGQKIDNDNYKILCRVIPRESYTKVILKNGRMKGCILIGDNNLEETFEFLIYNQIDLTRFGDHLLDDHLDVEDFFD